MCGEDQQLGERSGGGHLAEDLVNPGLDLHCYLLLAVVVAVAAAGGAQQVLSGHDELGAGVADLVAPPGCEVALALAVAHDGGAPPRILLVVCQERARVTVTVIVWE